MTDPKRDALNDQLERLYQRVEVQRQVFRQVRVAIWDMRDSGDLERLMEAIWGALSALGLSFDYCGVNIIERDGDKVRATVRILTSDGQLQSYEYGDISNSPLMRIWCEQRLVYRPDLMREDLYGERATLRRGVRSLVDVPYSHGTLALSAAEPDAFSAEDLTLVEEMTSVLAEGFSRLQDLRDLETRNRELEREIAERRQAEEAIRLNLGLQRVRNGILTMHDEDDWPQVAMALYDELVQFVDFDGWGINFVDEQAGTFFSYGVQSSGIVEVGEAVSPVPETVRRAMRENRPVYRRSRAEIERGGDNIGPGRDSVLDVPYTGGTIAVNSEREDAFDERDIRILEQFAQVVSEAHRRLEDLRLLGAREEQLRQMQKMEAVGELTSGIAHNFNNMLQGIMGNLFLAKLETKGEVKEQLESADGAAHRAAAMVRDLLVFARPGAQRNVESVEVGALVAEAAGICRETFDRRIELDIAPTPGPLRVSGDRGQLEQVLINILLNARDAVDQVAQPLIRLAADRVYIGRAEELPDEDLQPGAYVRVGISDNGLGMDKDILGRIFEPFFTTKPVDKGTGLGLSTTFSIVRQHGGWIACESELGAGSRFAVHLPAEPVAAAPDPPAPTGRTVLVIDDEDAVRLSTQRVLEFCGHEVLVASDGVEGLAAFKAREHIDLVLLDLSMPRMSGEEVLAELRRLAPDVKVLLFTGYTTEEGEYEGVAGVVGKPFRGEHLIQRVAAILRE